MKKDVFWGYLSQFLQYGAALLVLPLLLRKLSSAELGVWYVFMTISALVSMLDMGLTPTLSRNVSYALSGVKRLQKNGFEVVAQADSVDYGMLRAMISASRSIFFWISVIALILLVLPGSVYILRVAEDQIEPHRVLYAWAIFVLASVINLFYKCYTPLLQGSGKFTEFYKSNAVANLGFVVVSAVLLQANLGLLAVALGYLASALLGRWLSWRYFYDESFKAHLDRAPTAAVGKVEVLGVLWHNAWRLGLCVIGAFFILRANTLLASVYLGLATTAAYALTLQVFAVVQSVSTVVFNVQLPKLARYRVTDQHQLFRQTMEQGLGKSLGLFTMGTLLLVWLGAPLIQAIGGKTQLLPVPLLAWVGLMTLLELSHSLAAGVITTGNQVPFVKPALLSGLAVVLSSWVGLHYGGYSLVWLIGSQFAVQLAYNNWKWPWMIYKEFYSVKNSTCHVAPRG